MATDKIMVDANKLNEAIHKLKLSNYSRFKLIQEVIDLINEAITTED